jgi:uncharacterized membrane protein
LFIQTKNKLIKKFSTILLSVLATVVGLYPAIYLFLDRKFGLLASKTNELLADPIWNIGFYTHIFLGGLALLIGWTQFSSKFRNKNLALHRVTGKIYVVSALVSSATGIYIGIFATGGLIPSMGFICLGVIWFYTTLMAYIYIRNKQILQHQKTMIYSYAACFAGVTLRLWLPVLTSIFGNFITAYTIVAWLCWVPNLLVAYLITMRIRILKLKT